MTPSLTYTSTYIAEKQLFLIIIVQCLAGTGLILYTHYYL